MINDDAISKMLTLLAAMIAVYLSTFEAGQNILLYPAILLTVGITLQIFLMRRLGEVSIDGAKNHIAVIGYFVLASLIISVTGLAIEKAGLSLTGLDMILFVSLMAIVEERFFRGALTNFFCTTFTPYLGIVLSGAIFAVYHFARYGTDTGKLLFVFMGGFALSLASWKSGRLSPVMLAHLLNNVVAMI